MRFNKKLIVPLLFLLLFSGLVVAGPGDVLSKLFDSILELTDVNDLLANHNNQLPALLRFLIGITVFSLLYMAAKYVPVLKDDGNKNIRIVITVVISIISGIFIPDSVLLASGANFGIIFSALLVFGPVGAVLALILRSETNSKTSAGIKSLICLFLMGMVGVTTSWAQGIGHLHSSPNFVTEFAGWLEAILLFLAIYYLIKIFSFGSSGSSSSGSSNLNPLNWFGGGSSTPDPTPTPPSNGGYPTTSGSGTGGSGTGGSGTGGSGTGGSGTGGSGTGGSGTGGSGTGGSGTGGSGGSSSTGDTNSLTKRMLRALRRCYRFHKQMIKKAHLDKIKEQLKDMGQGTHGDWKEAHKFLKSALKIRSKEINYDALINEVVTELEKLPLEKKHKDELSIFNNKLKVDLSNLDKEFKDLDARISKMLTTRLATPDGGEKENLTGGDKNSLRQNNASCLKIIDRIKILTEKVTKDIVSLEAIDKQLLD